MTFIRYIGVDFTFGLLDRVRYNEDFSRFHCSNKGKPHHPLSRSVKWVFYILIEFDFERFAFQEVEKLWRNRRKALGERSDPNKSTNYLGQTDQVRNEAYGIRDQTGGISDQMGGIWDHSCGIRDHMQAMGPRSAVL